MTDPVATRRRLQPLLDDLSPDEQRQLWALLVETHGTREADAAALVSTLRVSPGANPSALGCLARAMAIGLAPNPIDEDEEE